MAQPKSHRATPVWFEQLKVLLNKLTTSKQIENLRLITLTHSVNNKGKFYPVTGHEGPEVE